MPAAFKSFGPPTVVLLLTLLLGSAGHADPPTREEKVRADRQKIEAEGFWIYGDLPKGFEIAKQTGKPLLVNLRCIPCEECVKLDDDLINQDPRVRPLLEKFVCVRVVSTNGLDLSLFQFDYDQSFAVFLLNADGTIYGRFGTRSHRTHWSDDVSIEGLAQALKGALELHAQYPENRAELLRKTGPAPEVSTPEQYPQLKDKYGPTLDYEGKVVQSCIHCHQIGEAQRQLFRERGEPIVEQLLFSYPHPKSLGLILDPREKATVLQAEKDSPAEQAGFEKGDRILRLEGQPLLSIADVQWVLHQTPPQEGSLQADVQRGGEVIRLTVPLPSGWRHRDDLSWRSSTWALRRMATGGLVLESVPLEEREKLGISQTEMALQVRHVGQYDAHAAAQRAGFRRGDILVSFDGRSDLQRETDLLAYALSHRKPGEEVAAIVLREGHRLKLRLPMQE